VYLLTLQAFDPVALKLDDIQDLEEKIKPVSQLVLDVEEEDPWMKSTFGISGTGTLIFHSVHLFSTSEFFLDCYLRYFTIFALRGPVGFGI
jgi:hypothetical protein